MSAAALRCARIRRGGTVRSGVGRTRWCIAGKLRNSMDRCSHPMHGSLPWLRSAALAAALLCATASPVAVSQQKAAESAGPYVPTPWVIVDEILTLAGVGPSDFVVDLGSGDGRLVLTAVTRFKAKGGFGVDIEAPLVADANDRARRDGVADKVKFHVRDLFDTKVGEASVVTLYLLPTSVPKLEPKLLAELAPGSRVVSHDYPFPDWPHDRYVKLD